MPVCTRFICDNTNASSSSPAAVLLYTALPMITELAPHTQGTYVAQKLITNINNQQELVDVCRAVLPDTPTLIQVRDGGVSLICLGLCSSLRKNSIEKGERIRQLTVSPCLLCANGPLYVGCKCAN